MRATPPPSTWNFWPGTVSAASARKAKSMSVMARWYAGSSGSASPRSARPLARGDRDRFARAAIAMAIDRGAAAGLIGECDIGQRHERFAAKDARQVLAGRRFRNPGDLLRR